jgi:NAD(P)-dependent dehydrogenase (short-subunit alcohol dehydrogenase family)
MILWLSGPDFIETPSTQPFPDMPQNIEYEKNKVPQKRIGRPNNILGSALFLAFQESYFVTGQTIFVDGGFIYFNPTVRVES